MQALGDEAWARFEAENGFRPPADYRALIDRYGVGGFGIYDDPWLSMFHPIGAGYTFVDQSSWQRSVNLGFQRRYPDTEPDWPMWPAPGGFLPWAGTDEGDQIGWLTAGAPDEWGTAFYGRQFDYFRFEFGCVEFVYRWFTGTTGVEECDALGGDPFRFFSSGPPDPNAVRPPSVDVNVFFLGIGAGDEGEAVQLVDRWRATVPEDGIIVRGCGRTGTSEEPWHWEIALEIPPTRESVAKEWVVSLAEDLGIGVREVRNLEYDLVWDDVVRRTG